MGDESAEDGVAVDATRGRVVLLVLAAVQFTNIVDFMIVMPLGQRLTETLGIDARQFAWVVASYALSASAAGLLAASVVDRFDRKTAFLTLYAGFLVGTLCCGLAPGYRDAPGRPGGHRGVRRHPRRPGDGDHRRRLPRGEARGGDRGR